MSEGKRRDDIYLVVTTFPNEEVAGQIGTSLVEAQLVACVNLISGAKSIYRWEGKIQTDAEVIGILKTRENILSEVKERLCELHPYEVPEILALRVDDGSSDYLDWVRKATEPE